MDKIHSIKMAAKRSGLTPHVIRVWERRYGAVEPVRTGSNRRLYSEPEIERLTLLRHAIAAGYRIGNIARLPAEDLRRLVASTPPEAVARAAVDRAKPAGPTVDFESDCLAAIRRLDANALELVLERALVVLGHQGLLQRVIAPVAQALGELWQRGEISAAHEHFASAVLRTFLGQAARPFAVDEYSPVLVVATPSGQLHELGAVMIAFAARNLGWRAVYLGASLPAAEIAGAATQNRARAVALSLVYPTDDPALSRELLDLRRYLASEVRLLAGGRALGAYREILDQIGAFQSEDLGAFGRHLEELRGLRPAT